MWSSVRRWLDGLLGRSPTVSKKYERIAKQIDRNDLERLGTDTRITEADVLGDLTGDHFHVSRISDYYTEGGFEFALERYGLMEKIRELGFVEFRFAFDTGDPKSQRIACYASRDGGEHLLMDLTTGRVRRAAPPGIDPPGDLELLSIEWMLLQNPTAAFPPDHPRWPGQDYPGLGVTEELMLLQIQSAKRLGLDGVVNHPSRYHVAFLGREHARFLDPEIQGRFEAVREALSALELSDAAWRMERGEVRWQDDASVVRWQPEDYVFATSDRLLAYLGSPAYEGPRDAARRRALARGFSF